MYITHYNKCQQRVPTAWLLFLLFTARSNPCLIYQTFNSNVHLIFNIWPFLYDRNATATVIFLNVDSGKRVKHQNM